jgi:hypothetical protein
MEQMLMKLKRQSARLLELQRHIPLFMLEFNVFSHYVWQRLKFSYSTYFFSAFWMASFSAVTAVQWRRQHFSLGGTSLQYYPSLLPFPSSFFLSHSLLSIPSNPTLLFPPPPL